jgi:hypothetical protein
MNHSSPVSVCILFAMLCGVAAPALADNRLSIDSDAVTISIEPHPAGRSQIRLPAVEFTFSVDAECGDNLGPGPLTLSIADTYLSLSAEQINTDSLDSIVLRVPAIQIAPVAVADFCIDDVSDGQPSPPEQMLVRDALSVQASLVCSSEANRQSTYASRSLDIRLQCDTSAPDQFDTASER